MMASSVLKIVLLCTLGSVVCARPGALPFQQNAALKPSRDYVLSASRGGEIVASEKFIDMDPATFALRFSCLMHIFYGINNAIEPTIYTASKTLEGNTGFW